MTIEEINEDGNIRLCVEGKIDTLTSPDFQDVLLKTFQKATSVIIDMEKVSYISSAALRALMLGQRTAASKGGTLYVINVSPQVKDVFRVTGFEKVLDIR